MSPYSVSQKNPPLKFSDIFSPNGWEFFSPNFTCLLHVPIYAALQIFIELPATLMKLCHIKRDHHHMLKMSTIDQTHAGWSHLIWHNFVRVGDNWIKICTLAYIWTLNRHVKFGLKICQLFGENIRKCKRVIGRWWTFCTHDVNWVVTGHA